MTANEATLQRELHESPHRFPPQLFELTALLDRYWVEAPATLRRYSLTLSAAWADGMYLTAWRLGRLLPAIVFLLGLVEGATHLSFFTVGDGIVSATEPTVAFAQNLVLVFLAAAIGSLSANLGLTLVIGYALGDYLLAGPQLTISSEAPLAVGLYLHVPQLLSYVLFFMVAVLPTLTSWHLLEDLRRRLPGRYSRNLMIWTAGAAVVQGVIVYAWTLAAPMVFRLMWIWRPGSGGSPIAVTYYQQVAVPWVPAVAAAAIIARGWLEWRAYRDVRVVDRAHRTGALLIRADGRPAFTRRLHPGLQAGLLAVLLTLLTSGFFASPLEGVAILLIFAAILIGRASWLPRLPAWRAWVTAVGRIPVVVRLGVAMIATYFLARLVFAALGNSTGLNTEAGEFGAQLIAIVLGLLTAVALGVVKPVPEKSGFAAGNWTATRSPSTIPWRRVSEVALVVLFLALTPLSLYAVCQDPSCCFGDPPTAGLGTSGLGFGLFLLGMIGGALGDIPGDTFHLLWANLASTLGGQSNFNVETDNAVVGVRG